mmetsp:Transcript_32271/g.42744  ORF Transcript_32271/g.42744 Transcript_32271/m.42744 type:complete len:150 (+) Transcript_32271:248-697(+)
MRGKLVRSRMKKIRQLLRNRDEMSGVFDNTIDETAFFFNSRVKEVYNREGAFDTPAVTGLEQALVMKEPYRMKNGVIYWGEWTDDLKTRMGKGRLVWLDGSLYEGQWYNGQSHGIGRLIHADGDIYVGEWRANKANGEGKYLHFDGSVY